MMIPARSDRKNYFNSQKEDNVEIGKREGKIN